MSNEGGLKYTQYNGCGYPPLPEDDFVQVKFQDGTRIMDFVGSLSWEATGGDKDIVAYRLLRVGK